MLVDGVVAKTVDFYSATTRARRTVFAQDALDPTVKHTVEVRALLGKKRSASSGTRVDADAFAALR